MHNTSTIVIDNHFVRGLIHPQRTRGDLGRGGVVEVDLIIDFCRFDSTISSLLHARDRAVRT